MEYTGWCENDFTSRANGAGSGSAGCALLQELQKLRAVQKPVRDRDRGERAPGRLARERCSVGQKDAGLPMHSCGNTATKG
jgi:hypothetical protein